jgi:hypothetical protein
MSIVFAIIVLIIMAVVHGMTNAYIDEFLGYLSSVLLPKGNSLPHSNYEARKLIKKLGLNYELIHCCPSGCVLYREENKALTNCPKPSCAKSRFLPDSTVIPTRVVLFYPFIP